jgi:hypothetical protein
MLLPRRCAAPSWAMADAGKGGKRRAWRCMTTSTAHTASPRMLRIHLVVLPRNPVIPSNTR